MMHLARQFPLRVTIGDGEALDSWLLRLAHRNGIPAGWLLTALGLADRVRVWRHHALVWRLPTDLLRRIETQTGLAPHALDQAVLDGFEPLGWKPIAGSWYCVPCLTELGGRWPIRWQLPYTFACTRHRCLLAAVCPACSRTPHNGLSDQAGLLPPHQCALRARPQGEICGADLRTHPVHPLASGDPRLTSQEWINQRLDIMNSEPCTDLRDLHALAYWFRQRIEPGDVHHLDAPTVEAVAEYIDPQHRHRQRRQPPSAPLLTAAVAAQAVALLTADDQTRYHRFVPLFRLATTNRQPESAGPPRAPMILSHKRMTTLSAPLQHKLLAACDPAPTDQ